MDRTAAPAWFPIGGCQRPNSPSRSDGAGCLPNIRKFVLNLRYWKSIDFAADGRSLWAPVYTNTRKWALLNIDLQGRTTTVLEDTNMTIGWASPAPDGRHLAFWKAHGNSNVWMLEGY